MSSENRHPKSICRNHERSVNNLPHRLLMGSLLLLIGLLLLSISLASLYTMPTQAASQPSPDVANFEKVDDFEGLSLAGLHGQNGWDAAAAFTVQIDPADGTNRVLHLSGQNVTVDAHKALPTSIDNSSIGTLHYRMRRVGHIDGFAGASDEASPNDWPSYEIQLGAQEPQLADQWMIRDNGGSTQVNRGFSENTWFCIWLVADNTSDTYQGYIQGGSFTVQTRLESSDKSTFSFRNGGSDPLQTFFTRSDERTQGDFYLDDIYVDPTSSNLTSPVSSCNGGVSTPTPIPTNPTAIPTAKPGDQPFQQVDDFENLSIGALGNQNGWHAWPGIAVASDPSDPSNQTLLAGSGNLEAYKAFPTEILNTDIGTLYFRYRRNGKTTVFNGASDDANPGDFQSFELQLGIPFLAADDDLHVRDGADSFSLGNHVTDNSWHCVWMVANNSTDTYEIYANGGNFTQVTQLDYIGKTSFQFRNGGIEPLRAFFMRVADDNSNNFYIDDIYVDPDSKNLTQPGGNCGTSSPVNAPPVAVNDNFSMQEDTTLQNNVLNNDSDPDVGDLLTVNTTAITAPSHGSLTLNSNGNFTYLPTSNYHGSDSFVYKVCDNGAPVLCAQGMATITIDPVNDPPSTVDDSYSIKQGTGLSNVNVLANDSDVENDPLTVNTVPVREPSHGTVTLQGNGSVVYTPSAGYSGSDSFDYQVCDSGTPVQCATATVFIAIQPVDSCLPTAAGDSYSTEKNRTLNGNVLSNDTVPAGCGILVIAPTPVQTPSHGAVTLNTNGSFAYTPQADYLGQDSFTYRVCVSGSATECGEGSVNITVKEGNVMPTAVKDEFTMVLNTSLTGKNVLDNDSDPNAGDLLIVDVTPLIAPSHGTVTLNADGSFTYTPTPDYVGRDSFVYRVCDNGEPILCAQAIVEITVTSGNVPPVAQDDSYTTAINTVLSGSSVLDNDSDPNPGDTLAVSSTPTRGPEHGTLTLRPDGTFTYTPKTGYSGEDSFDYRVCDNGTPALCSEGAVTITVTASANRPPIVPSDSYIAKMNTMFSKANLLGNVTDPNPGDTLAVNPTPIRGPAHGTVILHPDGTFTYQPDVGYQGEDSFAYEVCDDGSPILCGQGTATIAVEPHVLHIAYIDNQPTPMPTPMPTPTPTPTPDPMWRQLTAGGKELSAVVLHNGHAFIADRNDGIFQYELNDCSNGKALPQRLSRPVYTLAFRGALGVAGTANGIYISNDNGVNWSAASGNVADPFYALAFVNGRIFAGAENENKNNGKGLYVSENNGDTWTSFVEQPVRPNALTLSSSGSLWIGDLGEGVLELDLQTKSFTSRNNNLPGGTSKEVWALIFNSSGSDVYIGTGNGVFHAQASGGWQWERYGDSLNTKEVSSLAIMENQLFAGTKGNGVWRIPLSPGSDWTQVNSGNGWENTLTARDLLYEPNSCNGLLAATSNGLWVYR